MAQQNRINKIATDLDLDNLMLTDNEIQAVTGDLILATDGTNELKLQVGGSTYVDFFSSGAVSMPNQPSFFAYANAAVGNVTGAGVEVTVGYNTEKYDITNNYASNTFTAPITGKYLFCTNVSYTGLTSLMVGLSLKLNTSNQAYQVFNNPWLSSAAGTSGSINFSCVTDMDSADTAYITFIIYGGASNTADLQGTASTYSTYFSGHLIY
jgi:hypothetical protein